MRYLVVLLQRGWDGPGKNDDVAVYRLDGAAEAKAFADELYERSDWCDCLVNPNKVLVLDTTQADHFGDVTRARRQWAEVDAERLAT